MANQNDRVNEIDLLRFVAALFVVFFHYTFRGYMADHMTTLSYPAFRPFTKYGYLGVQLFFMISGFVILMTATGATLQRFAVSRLVRLYPGFWACCTITFLATLLIGGSRYTASLAQYIDNMTMLSGYADVRSIDGAYWSLFVEIRFYALVAIIVVLGKIAQADVLLAAWLICSMILEVHPSGRLCTWLVTEYSAYFIAGATYFLIWKEGLTINRIAVIAMSLILALYQEANNMEDFREYYHSDISFAVVAGIISAFFLVMLVISLRLTGRFGRRRWILAGALTYPLYLLHQNLGYMLFNVGERTVNVHVLLWGTVAGMLVLAYLVNRFVEQPLAPAMKRTLTSALQALNHLTRRVA